jgi:hypothetical protein
MELLSNMPGTAFTDFGAASYTLQLFLGYASVITPASFNVQNAAVTQSGSLQIVALGAASGVAVGTAARTASAGGTASTGAATVGSTGSSTRPATASKTSGAPSVDLSFWELELSLCRGCAY